MLNIGAPDGQERNFARGIPGKAAGAQAAGAGCFEELENGAIG